MNATAALQQQFQQFVADSTAGISTSIVDGPRIDADARLAIYANAYRSRLTEILASDYPALHALAGNARFREIAHAYICAHPSTHPNARWFGKHLPAFLANDTRFSPDVTLREMARFEWAMSLAFDAADETALTFVQLAQTAAVDWPALRFAGRASLQFVELTANLPAIWLAAQREENLPSVVQSDEATKWIVWRRSLTIWYRPLEEDEAWMLNAACESLTFAELCDGLSKWHEPEIVPLRAVELLKRWIEEELILPHSPAS